MTCERCKGLMLEFRIIVSGDALTQKHISAWHCRNCGRFEYGGLVETTTSPLSAISESVSTI